MTNLEQGLVGIIIALVSGTLGKFLGERGNVTQSHCNDKQKACQQLLLQKLTSLEDQLHALTNIVNNKLLGL